MENLLLTHLYAALILLALLEGPLLAIACGVACALGVLEPLPALAILVAGDLVPDLGYYFIGRFGARMPGVRRVARRTQFLRENLLALEHLWRERLLVTLLSAKLAYGVSAPFIVSAGMAGVPLPKFAASSLLVSIPYLTALFTVGFSLTETYGYLRVTGGFAPFLMSMVGLFFLGLLAYIFWSARRELRAAHARPAKNSQILGTRKSPAQGRDG